MNFLSGVKKLAALVLTLSFLGTASCFPVFARREERGYIVGTVYEEEKEYNQFPIVYSDDFFKGSSTGYDDRLAAASLALEMSSFSAAVGEPRAKRKSANVRDALRLLNFEEITVNDYYDGDSQPNGIGIAVGRKRIFEGQNDGCTLIPVVIRGGGYEAEWAGNLNVGESGPFHKGFDEASIQVKQFVDEYMKDQNITGRVKLWIVGYSRAGAVAGLVGHKYNKELNENRIKDKDFSLQFNDIYTYTFEAPNGVCFEAGEKYEDNNIHNIVCSEDPVTKVVPKEWGFAKPGKLLTVDSDKTLMEEIMGLYVANLPCNNETLDENKVNIENFGTRAKGFWAMVNSTSEYSQLADKVISFLTGAIRDEARSEGMQPREYFSKKLQPVLSKMLGALAKKDRNKREAFLKELEKNKDLKFFMEWDKANLFSKIFKGGWRVVRNLLSDSISEKCIDHIVVSFNKVFAGKDEISVAETVDLKGFVNRRVNRIKNILEIFLLAFNAEQLAGKHEPALHLARIISSIKDKSVLDSYMKKLKEMQKEYLNHGANVKMFEDYEECYCIDELLKDNGQAAKKIREKYFAKMVPDEMINQKKSEWHARYLQSLLGCCDRLNQMKDQTEKSKKFSREEDFRLISQLVQESTLEKIAEFKAHYECYRESRGLDEVAEHLGIECYLDDFGAYKIDCLKKRAGKNRWLV